jgi:hypothetical protein
VKELQRQANPNIIIALVGNKLDLAAQRAVPSEEAQAYANETGLLFTEASAKSGEFVMEVFTEIGKCISNCNILTNTILRLANQNEFIYSSFHQPRRFHWNTFLHHVHAEEQMVEREQVEREGPTMDVWI